ncbi:ABC transporter ATP-binding protein [Veronia pacifica]|uniref:ABC transporter domain-containing protein n=1 Tax=Veronia pacifica TaxID=1080227 RepID=A0A1C3ES56_9GAMM|nr:ATP-binding cassette domain-containing protein [Veronia pacifica]ODA36092.1 hypothetical protein A8L45_00355 [Veronia pacifica]
MTKLTVKNASRRVDGTDILSTVSIEFNPGVTGLVGANGAGKSSLLRAIALLDPLSEGDILINGKSVIGKPQTLYQQLGIVFQHSPCFEHLSVTEFLHYIAAMKGIRRHVAEGQISQWLNKVNLSSVKDRLMSDCSGGMRQRVGIVQALLGNPNILLLDEPTVALDHNERLSFYSFIKDISKTTTVIIVSHLSDDMEALADRLVFLAQGKVIKTGDLDALKAEASQSQTKAPLAVDDIISHFLTQTNETHEKEEVLCGV